MNIDRKKFVKSLIYSAVGISISPTVIAAHHRTTNPEKPKLDTELVKEFVANCHKDLQKVKELYSKEPLLLFSSHDWGNGDFENGIEAAGHTGNREIANFLIEKGARINFFTLCMLGKTELVGAMLKEYPEMLNAKGPHGFTPLHHASKGGADSIKVKTLLESLGAKELKLALY